MNIEDISRLAQEYASVLLNEDRSEVNPLDQLVANLDELPQPEPIVGQVWRVEGKRDEAAHWLVLTHVGSVLRGVLVLPNIIVATQEDIIVPADNQITGHPLLLVTKSDTPIPRQDNRIHIPGRLEAEQRRDS